MIQTNNKNKANRTQTTKQDKALAEATLDRLVDDIVTGGHLGVKFPKGSPKPHRSIKLGVDVHLDRYVVVRQIDGGAPQPPQWIEGDQAEALLSAQPDASPIQSLVDQQLPLLLGGLPDLQTALGKTATQRAALQLQAHERVREATRHRAKVRIEPVLPVDILGAYLLLPVL